MSTPLQSRFAFQLWSIQQRLAKHTYQSVTEPPVLRSKAYQQSAETRARGDAEMGARFFRTARIVTHGTVRAYCSHKCRCSLCRAARAAYDRTTTRDKAKKAAYNRRYWLKQKAARQQAIAEAR